MTFVFPKQRSTRHRTIKSLESQYHTLLHPEPKKYHFVPDIRPKTCTWLEGEPRDRLFCGAVLQPGSSYCPEHHARCFIKTNPLTPTSE